jgi:hypothetical protein
MCANLWKWGMGALPLFFADADPDAAAGVVEDINWRVWVFVVVSCYGLKVGQLL